MKVVMRPNDRYTSGLQQMITECVPEKGTVLEIGVFLGESTRIFLDSGRVSFITCVDAWTNGVDPTDLTTVNYDLSQIEVDFDRNLSSYLGRYEKVKGNSLEVASQFPDKHFDLVYLDASHEYASVKREIELYLPKVKDSGYIAGHDYDSPYHGVARAVAECLGRPDKVFEDTSWVVKV